MLTTAKSLHTKTIYLCLIAAFVIVQTGCVDLTALREFTDESVKAGKVFKSIAEDSYRSCAKTRYFEQFRKKAFKDIDIFVSADEYLEGNKEAAAICSKDKENATKFVTVNKILMTYLYVLGDLAGDDVGKTGVAFDNAQEELANISGTPNPTISAAASIAKTLATIAQDSKRQNAIRNGIIHTDESIKGLTEGISEYLGIYIDTLKAERNSAEATYKLALKHQEELHKQIDGKPQSDALLVVLSSAQLNVEVQDINAKITAAKAYQKVLSEIRDGHHELFEVANSGFKKRDAIRIALKYGPAIKESYDSVKKAFE